MSRYLAVMTGLLILGTQGAYAEATNSRSYNDGLRAGISKGYNNGYGDGQRTGYSNGYNYGYDDGIARRQRNDQYRMGTYRPRGDGYRGDNQAYRGDTQNGPDQSRYTQNNYGQDCQRTQTAGTGSSILGLLLGGAVGNTITRDVDCGDRAYAMPAYKRGLEGEIGTRYDWRNEQDNDYGHFTPTREYDQGQNTCREFTETTYRDGQELRRQGTACRYPDGQWHFQ
jgi:surface antigen